MFFNIVATIFTALTAFIAFKAVTAPTLLIRVSLSVATAICGSIASMFWMFPTWIRAAEQEVLTQMAKHGEGSPDGNSIYVGWDLREMWVEVNGPMLPIWAVLVGLLLLLGIPSVRTRLFGNG